MRIKDLQKEAHALAREKGWYDEPRSVGDLIALCHSELSEALEEHRSRVPHTEIREVPIPMTPLVKLAGFPVELADLILRVADMAEFLGIDMEEAIRVKMEYNRNRPYRHGGKAL